jgi:hypothetical protein
MFVCGAIGTYLGYNHCGEKEEVTEGYWMRALKPLVEFMGGSFCAKTHLTLLLY